MSQIKILRSIVSVVALIAGIGSLSQAPAYASEIKKISHLEAGSKQGQRLEVIKRLMEEHVNADLSAPAAIKKLNNLGLLDHANNAVLQSTIKKTCELFHEGKLKEMIMNLEEGEKEFNQHNASLDAHLRLNNNEKEIFKDLFVDIPYKDLKEFAS